MICSCMNMILSCMTDISMNENLKFRSGHNLLAQNVFIGSSAVHNVTHEDFGQNVHFHP